ncbi:MAG: hypothetical protein ACRENO_04735, partial [Thermodesulfobacteriota bacterium]
MQKIDPYLQQKDSDIQILSRQKNEYKEYMGEAILDFPIESVLGFVRSNENGDWIDNTDNFDSVLLNYFESCICHEFRSFGFRRKILYYAMQEKSLCGSPIIINFGIDPQRRCNIEKDLILDNCSDINSSYQVNEFYGYYKLVPIEKNKTRVV